MKLLLLGNPELVLIGGSDLSHEQWEGTYTAWLAPEKLVVRSDSHLVGIHPTSQSLFYSLRALKPHVPSLGKLRPKHCTTPRSHDVNLQADQLNVFKHQVEHLQNFCWPKHISSVHYGPELGRQDPSQFPMMRSTKLRYYDEILSFGVVNTVP